MLFAEQKTAVTSMISQMLGWGGALLVYLLVDWFLINGKTGSDLDICEADSQRFNVEGVCYIYMARLCANNLGRVSNQRVSLQISVQLFKWEHGAPLDLCAGIVVMGVYDILPAKLKVMDLN